MPEWKFGNSQPYIVTGASSGIGRSVALELNASGAKVIALGRNATRLGEMRRQSLHPENMHLECCDLADNISRLPSYATKLKEKYGKFSGMAYCAGITLNQPLLAFDLGASTAVFDINYFAPIALAKGVADRRNNIGRGCSLAFVSSIHAIQPVQGLQVYAGAKAALCASVKCMARGLAPYGIRANCVLPSAIETPMTTSNSSILESEKQLYPMGIGKPEDVARIICFLLSDMASWITGQDYIVDCASY